MHLCSMQHSGRQAGRPPPKTKFSRTWPTFGSPSNLCVQPIPNKVYRYTYIYICVCVYVCVNIYIYIYMCVCVCYIYICVCVCTACINWSIISGWKTHRFSPVGKSCLLHDDQVIIGEVSREESFAKGALAQQL